MKSNSDPPIITAGEIMEHFAAATGLQPADAAPRRYLWTDAFAVCNFLGLYAATGQNRYRNLALQLVEQVHNVLGRHRQDDPRQGWISGLNEREGAGRPTAGGLRIGKKINERQSSDPVDERLEWDRDGQYYHYLTKWMHALNRVSRVTNDQTYSTWAMDLARTAHRAFAYPVEGGGPKRLYWKMSIDLSRPLVASMGHHDPLDGLITYCQLQVLADRDRERQGPGLEAEINDLAAMCLDQDWTTDDPLGLGGLLSDGYQLAQLTVHCGESRLNLLDDILAAALDGLVSYRHNDILTAPAPYRLAFRELGLAIGLRAVQRLEVLVNSNPDTFAVHSSVPAHLNALLPYLSLGSGIEKFWLQPENRDNSTWAEHQDINMVMLATALAPDGYLTL
jgi:hypothetical protein